MQTLVLPAQDQLACYQDERAKRVAGMLHSPRLRPRSQGNACGSSSQLGPARSDVCETLDAPGDGIRQIDASSGEFQFHAEKQSSIVAKALTLHIFHPARRSCSRASANLPRPSAAESSAESIHISTSRNRNASGRYSSVPKGYAFRRYDGGGASRNLAESEGTKIGAKVGVSESMICGNKSGGRSASQFTGRVIHRYFSKSSGEVKTVVGTQSISRSERCSGFGGRTLDREEIDLAENKRIARTGSGKSYLREASISCQKVGATPAVTILQRPKAKDEALSHLVKFLGGEEPLDMQNRTVSSSVCQSVSGASLNGALLEETVVTRCSLYHGVGSHNPACEGASTTTHSSKSRTDSFPPKNAAASEILCTSAGNLGNASCGSAPHRHVDGLSCVRSIPRLREKGVVPHGKSLMQLDLKDMCTSSRSSDDKECRQEESLSSPLIQESSCSPPMNERWAGPAYSNSPPPSSLPFPKFSIRQLRTSSLEIPLNETEFGNDGVGSGSLSAPSTPSRSLLPFLSESSPTAVFLGLGLDVAYATKDLRRILNLDSDT